MERNTIAFWGYPDVGIIQLLKKQYPKALWLDLDKDFKSPDSNILPDAYCKIIRNILDNAVYFKDKILKIVAPIGKDKCDSGWFAAKILADMGFDVIETKYEVLNPHKKLKFCTADMPLAQKIDAVMDSIIEPVKIDPPQCEPAFGFWGVPPNDFRILDLFPNNTHIYGWIRCVEAGVPADVELEMFVDENVPTVFYAQAFCAKSQLAKYLAQKYNGLYVDVDDYATNSIIAKIEAFVRLR